MQLLDHEVEGRVPGGGALWCLGIGLDQRGEQTLRGVDVLVIQAVAVGHPAAVHLVILARGDAVHLALARPDVDVGAGAAVHVDGRRALQEPDAHPEAEILAGERTHGAEVHGVHGVIAVQRGAGVAGNGVVGTAVHDSQHFLAHDFLHEANAAAAQHAALLVQIHARADGQVLALLGLGLSEAVRAATVVGGVFLELALAGLVADGAVQRVVGQQELQHALAGLFGHLAVGADTHVLCHGVGAGDDGAGHPGDGLVAVLIIGGGGTGRQARGHALFHQAHAAGTHHGELRVIAEGGHVRTHGVAGIHDTGALGELIPGAVNLDIDLAGSGSGVLRQYCGNRAHEV